VSLVEQLTRKQITCVIHTVISIVSLIWSWCTRCKCNESDHLTWY